MPENEEKKDMHRLQLRKKGVSPEVYVGLSVTAEDIMFWACKCCNIPRKDLTSKSRERELVDTRMICFLLFNQLLHMAHLPAGMLLLRTEATAKHAVRLGKDLLDSDMDFKKKYDRVMKNLKPVNREN